jgi:hypothetical protein
MTEAEWIACADPALMLASLGGRVPERKLRLLGCGCCRRAWRSLRDERSRRAIEVTEEFADGRVSPVELAIAHEEAHRAWGTPAATAASEISELAWKDGIALRVASLAAWAPTDQLSRAGEQRRQADVIRCVFGNPFRPSTPLPSAVLTWNDRTVRRIAEGIYAERAFDRLPILADALLDAGCDDEELIAHCRSEGPHVRGCWSVDLILGKS